MMKYPALFLLFLTQLTLVPRVVNSQQQQQPLTLAQTLTPLFFPVGNEASAVLFPPEVLTFETPVAVHYTFTISIAGYEPYAACSERRLSFFGIRDPISPRLCNDEDLLFTTIYLTYFYSIQLAFPGREWQARNFLRKVGVDFSTSKDDTSTPQGWAFRAAKRIANFTINDGWNSQGSDSDVFPQRYADTTDYRPKNPSNVSPKRLPFPLRWQPLTESVDGYGAYSTQVHITPHIGLTSKPLSMPISQWNSVLAKPPYRFPNAYGKMASQDAKLLKQKLIPDMLERMSSVPLDSSKIFRSYWWDNKFISVALFGVYYDFVLGPDVENLFLESLAENMALRDATLLAWREKRRTDLNRPGPLIRRMYPSDAVLPNMWRGLYKTGGPVPVREWSSVVRTMPHSEFPSATATMCAASLGTTKRILKGKYGSNFTEPPFTIPFTPGTVGIPVRQNVTIFYNGIDEAIADCGESRLWSGLHFTPSVTEGLKIGAKVAEGAYNTWLDLQEGRIPSHCHWCVKNP